MIADHKGSVFYGKYTVLTNRKDMFLQWFLNEKIENTTGGAIVVEKMNYIGFTFVQNCVFYNNFGSEGGAISLSEGGGLFAMANEFSMLTDYQKIGIPDSLNELY